MPGRKCQLLALFLLTLHLAQVRGTASPEQLKELGAVLSLYLTSKFPLMTRQYLGATRKTE
jgi:hypothetical protein